MKLGNSNGNNKGKRYFVRGRDDLDIDQVYAEEAERFAQWFAQNMGATRRQLVGKGCYDGEVLSETYLRIYEIILYTGRHIVDYASYFHRAYFTNSIQLASKENRYLDLFDNYDVEEDNDADYWEEVEAVNQSLNADIMDYVYHKYELHEFELFKMYVSLKPAITYQQLADMTNGKYSTVRKMIAGVIKDVKTNPSFACRRRQVASA